MWDLAKEKQEEGRRKGRFGDVKGREQVVFLCTEFKVGKQFQSDIQGIQPKED